MKIGISTGCLYPMLTEETVSLLLSEGFDTFEIFFNTFSELEGDYLDRLKDMLDRKNASVHSVHPFTSSYESYLLFSGYQRRFEDGVNMYEMYFRTAKRLGADKVVLHGMRSDFAAIGREEYFRRFELLCHRAASYGSEFLQENVNLHCSNDPDFIAEMIKTIPESAGFVLDTKQALRGGYSPSEFALMMGDKLRHVHISDCTKDGRCILPGEGIFDFEEFFSVLKKINYDGDLIIEVYRTSFDGISELKKSMEYLEGYL